MFKVGSDAFEIVVDNVVELVAVGDPVEVGFGVEVVVTAVLIVVHVCLVGEVVERSVGSSRGLVGKFGEEELESGVSVEGVVSVDSKAFNQLEGLCIGKDVVSSGAEAGGVCVAGGFVVDSSPLGGVCPYIKPSFVC